MRHIKPTNLHAEDEAPLPKSTCPNCGLEIDAALCIEMAGVLPVPGDISICVKCGEVLTFNDILVVNRITPHDLEKLDPKQRMLIDKAVATIKSLNFL